MRIDEFASAEEQLELWKLVNQSVMGAIDTQRRQQKKAAEAKAAEAKLKPRKGRGKGGGKISIPSPGPRPPPPKKPGMSAQPPVAKTLPPVGTAQAQQPPTGQGMAKTQLPATLAKAPSMPKDGVFAPDIAQKKSEPRGDDRHSKNGLPALSQLPRVGARPPTRVGSYTK